MSIYSVAKHTIEYLSEGFLGIFSPSHDDYPSIGIQPFEGEICKDGEIF